jgi:hypothetical protein
MGSCLFHDHCLTPHLYVTPSLRLFILNGLQLYCHFFLSGAVVLMSMMGLTFPLHGSGTSHGDYFPTAPTASSRPLTTSGSLIRCTWSYTGSCTNNVSYRAPPRNIGAWATSLSCWWANKATRCRPCGILSSWLVCHSELSSSHFRCWQAYVYMDVAQKVH